MRSALPARRRWRDALLRGIVWSLIGIIYAPLFTGLVEIFTGLGLGSGTYTVAAALAGGVGAALYGSREIALIATGIGAIIGVFALMAMAEQAVGLYAVALAATVAGLLGLAVRFPAHCSRHVPGKTLAGLGTGALSGTLLAIASAFHAEPFPLFVALAFLVSVNGVLYVATVRWWLQLSYRLHCESRSCQVVESLVMALLAGLAAGSVWMVIGPLLNIDEGFWYLASVGLHEQVKLAALGGGLGGGIAGILLELFRFSWVHDI